MVNDKLRDVLDWTDDTQNYLTGMLDKASGYEAVVIFGAGIGGKITLDLLRKYGMGSKAKAFCDNNVDKIGSRYLDIEVVSPEAIRGNYEDALILISSTAFDVISGQLVKLGLRRENLYYFQPAGISLDSGEDMAYIKGNIEKFEEAYEMLMDGKSRILYRNLLNYRISKNIKWLDEIKAYIDEEKDQYFDEELLKGYRFEETFIDAGAYVGDTLQSFFEHFPHWEGQYCCFEAAHDTFVRLAGGVKSRGNFNIRLYEYALWDKKGTIKFDAASYGSGEGSRISADGETVNCESLDGLFFENTDIKEISFIKMDIEGAEHNALAGAEQILRRDKPVLAVCIYHKREDFFDIPLLINRICENEYEFYIRQYRYGQSETVLYAMPKSRKV